MAPWPCAAPRVGLPRPPHLPDWSPPRAPHAELSCSKNEKELEELLLEASQESGQETL